jgi:hypothetical protein
MHNQMILISLAMASLLLVVLPKAFAADQQGTDQTPEKNTADLKPDKSTDTGPTITQKEIDNPKSIHIPGQNKCQTLDGFSASEPCPSVCCYHAFKCNNTNSWFQHQ